MFCGIIDHIGILDVIDKKNNGMVFRVRSQFRDFVQGESIAVDGVCLTVTASDDDWFECELSSETLTVSIASQYQVGQLLNLERAMCMSDRIDGHLITGHVDKTLIVDTKEAQDDFIALHFSACSKEDLAFLVPKGSVTINGVSLTVNAVDDMGFSVMLIPHTLQRTNLSRLNPDSQVNVEWDYMAKLVKKQVERYYEISIN